MGGFFSLHTRISGTYHGAHDPIASETLHVSFRTRGRLKELLLKVQVENEGAAGDSAYIDEIIDVHTDSLNGALTSGGMVHITGNKIKVEGSEAEAGVWLVSENLGVNKSAEVMALLPALSAGTYTLEIVTRDAGGTPLKEPRTIRAGTVLTVS
jgi:hypothetical protein